MSWSAAPSFFSLPSAWGVGPQPPKARAHDGDHVKAGDILVRLDETVTRANLAIITKGLTELYARKARLGAERDGADTVAVPRELAGRANDEDVQQALASERKLFELRR